MRRDTPVLDLLRRAAIAVGAPTLRICTWNRALPVGRQCIDQGSSGSTLGGDGNAAIFIATAVVGCQVDIEIIGGFPQQLHTCGAQILVAVGGGGTRTCPAHHVLETIALALCGIHAQCTREGLNNAPDL
ncbi:hypothetical protein [Xanthomonas fragariae]|uniref:hypothetical protein n=1 Tax=Xanthomonas fragariae TaxID=48664 RepID=UPI001E559CEC|nr:hypothetical protein [Xanthomonas fragariae]